MQPTPPATSSSKQLQLFFFSIYISLNFIETGYNFSFCLLSNEDNIYLAELGNKCREYIYGGSSTVPGTEQAFHKWCPYYYNSLQKN